MATETGQIRDRRDEIFVVRGADNQDYDAPVLPGYEVNQWVRYNVTGPRTCEIVGHASQQV